jgi:hypothetical protein
MLENDKCGQPCHILVRTLAFTAFINSAELAGSEWNRVHILCNMTLHKRVQHTHPQHGTNMEPIFNPSTGRPIVPINRHPFGSARYESSTSAYRTIANQLVLDYSPLQVPVR